MSFDFNVLSSDDEDGNVGKEETFVGGILNASKNGSLKPTMDGNDSDVDSTVQYQNMNNGGFEFDGYNDYYDFDEDDRKPSSMDSSSSGAMAFPSDFDKPLEDTKEDDEEDGEVDWEDAHEEEQETSAQEPTSSALKEVTLDLSKDPTKDAPSSSKKGKKRARSVAVFKHEKLQGNPGLQSLLSDLHKASLLAWAAHAHFCSAQTSDLTNLGLAHSLVPTAWLWKDGTPGAASMPSAVTVPTQEDIGHFVHWFVNYVRSSSSGDRGTRSTTNRTTMTRTGKRVRSNLSGSDKRQTKHQWKKQQVSSENGHFSSHKLANYYLYLSNRHQDNHSEHSSIFNDFDTLLLFLSMVRSMGWRARYVVALEPISRDLDVNHPLFSNHANGFDSSKSKSNNTILSRFFGSVLSAHQGRKETPIALDEEEEDSKSPAQNISSDEATKYPASLYSGNAPFHGTATQHVCWAEILCKTTPSNGRKRTDTSPNMQWLHVDPVAGVTNQPSFVEETLFEKRKQKVQVENSTSKKKHKSSRSNHGHNKHPISYALAVEHLHSYSDDSVRMTDVTRRYSSSMVATMEARGIVMQKQSSKPKKRKQWKEMMMGTYGNGHHETERPDQWFAKFLDTMSKRDGSNRIRNRKPPPPGSSTKASREALQSKGNSKEDAIALESDDSDADQKPAAVESKHDAVDHEEESQLQESVEREPLPTSKAAFKKHPLYVIRSVLNTTEVLKPEAKHHVCGMFKGELVFRRKDVDTALSAKRWLYEGRKVRSNELNQPILKQKARKAPKPKGFQELKSYGVGASNDGSEESRLRQIQSASEPMNQDKMESLYGSWQTDEWSPPPVNPGDPIPVNEHNNIELELLNPGLVHVELYKVAKVAKKLGLPYAPCLLGFEGSGKPTIRGIVVHETNEVLLREAHAVMQEHLLQEEQEKREREILLRWKRLLVGVLTKDRLEREYGNNDDDDG